MNRSIHLLSPTFQTTFLCSFPTTHFKVWGVCRSLLFVSSYLERHTGGVYDIKALDGLGWNVNHWKVKLIWLIDTSCVCLKLSALVVSVLLVNSTWKIKRALKVASNTNLTSTSQCVSSIKPPNYAVSLDSVKSLRHFQERWCNCFACFNLLGMPDGWSLPYQDIWNYQVKQKNRKVYDFHFHVLLSKLHDNFHWTVWGKPRQSGMHN